jgi:hypothetical protein
MTNSVDVRARIADAFRRDLIGPDAKDADLANEHLNESSRAGTSPDLWHLRRIRSASTATPARWSGSISTRIPSAALR